MMWQRRLTVLLLAVLFGFGCSAVVDPDGSDLGGPGTPLDGGADDLDGGDGTDGGGGPGDGGGDSDDGGSGDDAGPEECDTPGRTERVSCGEMCGTAQRVCTEEGVWERGPCEDEGECVPGSSVEVSCGEAGNTEVTCTEACEVPPGGCPVDVMLLLDRTGSHNETISRNQDALMGRLVAPLLDSGDVRVGVSYFADFPREPYGSGGDEPFGGELAPTADSEVVRDALGSLPEMSGGDFPESGVEAMNVLSGGPPHDRSDAFDCEGDRVAGGCWRPGSVRAVVVITDIGQHNAPTPVLGGSLLEPYDESLGAPVWSDVRPQLQEQNVALFSVVRRRTRTADGYRQVVGLVRDLGATPSDRVVGYRTTSESADLREELSQMASLLMSYFGL